MRLATSIDTGTGSSWSILARFSKLIKVTLRSNQKYFWFRKDIKHEGTLQGQLGLPLFHRENLPVNFSLQGVLRFIQKVDGFTKFNIANDYDVNVTCRGIAGAGDGTKK